MPVRPVWAEMGAGGIGVWGAGQKKDEIFGETSDELAELTC